MGDLIQRVTRDGERAAEVKLYPFPPDAPTREECPACGKWLKATADGRVRRHGPRALPCPASGTGDVRPYAIVAMAPMGVVTVYRFTGRRSAEVAANQYRRDGIEPIVYRLETP